MLLAGPISHTSTQYIDFFDFLHFNGSACLPIILLILVGVELPLRVVVTILECCVTFSGVKLSIRSFVLFISTYGDNISTVGGNISTVEDIQYRGIPSVQWGITSVQWGIASVLWRLLSTVGITI